MTYEQAERLLKEKGQEQLLRFYKELNGAERSRLLEGIEKIDWSFEEVLKNPEDLSGKGRDIRPIEGMSLKDIKERREEFFAAGAEAIRSGKVAADLTTEEADAYAAAQRRDIMTNVGVVFDLSERAEQETYALLDLDGDGTAEKLLLRSRMAQAVNEGKPQNIAEKMVNGRIAKYYKEVCITEQPFIKDGDKIVSALTKEVADKIGTTIEIVGFARFEKGEGLEKREDDFAGEIEKMLK